MRHDSRGRARRTGALVSACLCGTGLDTPVGPRAQARAVLLSGTLAQLGQHPRVSVLARTYVSSGKFSTRTFASVLRTSGALRASRCLCSFTSSSRVCRAPAGSVSAQSAGPLQTCRPDGPDVWGLPAASSCERSRTSAIMFFLLDCLSCLSLFMLLLLDVLLPGGLA